MLVDLHILVILKKKLLQSLNSIYQAFWSKASYPERNDDDSLSETESNNEEPINTEQLHDESNNDGPINTEQSQQFFNDDLIVFE